MPEGLAHRYHHPEAAGRGRWDDDAFAIEWPPAERRIVSERDRIWPDFTG